MEANIFLNRLPKNILTSGKLSQWFKGKGADEEALSAASLAESVVDDKAVRMMKLHERGEFSRSWTTRRMVLLQAGWVVRNRVLGSLKRALDLTIGTAALMMTSPLMLATALAVKLDSPGPVFYKQERVGRWGKTFSCFKFRSMYVDADRRKAELAHLNEADEVVFKIKHDPRVTRVGRIIRKLSIDELPQLLNVLKGDMSLVGPRPPVPIEVVNYKYEHFRRLDAVPGITGLQQVSGRSDLNFKRWVELDVEYIENQSLRKDIEILAKTIPAVISGKGAY